jgi:2'-5' RNA ligase
MPIRASLVPPRDAASHLAAALRDSNGEQDQIAWLPPEHWTLHVARFGSLSRHDKDQIFELLADEIAAVPPVELWLEGILPLPEDGDNAVWVGVHGQTDLVAEIANAIPAIVKQAGFLLDRRAFRPRIQLGKVTMRTTLPYLEHLVARLGDYQGSPWTANAVVLGHEAVSGSDVAETYEFVIELELPLQGIATSAGA